MKAIFKLLPVLLLSVAVSCDWLSGGSVIRDDDDTTQQQGDRVKESDLTFERISEDEIKIGNHTYQLEGILEIDAEGNPVGVGDLNRDGEIEQVIFNAFPSSEAEFNILQRELLGKRLGGTVALHVMALELYRRNRTEGEPCLKKINEFSTTLMNVVSQRFPKTRTAETTDAYQQPYFVAALLDGSTIENKYTPSEPYTITVKWSPSETHHKADGTISYGDYYKVAMMPGGYANSGSTDRKITIHMDYEGTPYLMINECAAITSAVANIRGWVDNLK